jgi:pimeloyl-ACP methyl ester carboxylesterase
MSHLYRNRIQLRDGRLLGYAEYGDLSGRPVSCFPGTPGSRLLHPPEDPTIACGARLIVVERPGFGLSDDQPGRTLLHWPEDVVEFADQLELKRFAAVGISAGAPYAAACAHTIPQRISAVGIISGVGPMDAPGSLQEMPRIRRAVAIVARHAPCLLRPLLWWTANPQRDIQRFFPAHGVGRLRGGSRRLGAPASQRHAGA